MARRPAGSGRLGRSVAESWYEARPTLGRRLLLGCLAPASWAYRAATAVRGRAYDRGWLATERAPIPVVSVGNLVVGGAGKTPVVLEVATRLQDLGHRVAILSRGYGARRQDARVVSDGTRLLLEAEDAGDEPHLLARRCAGAVVLAGPDRAALARRAAAEHGATIAILDDGLQHRRLHRDLEIVVIDASEPVGNGRLFPRGPLREAESALARAHLVWLSRTDETGEQPLAAAARLDAMLRRSGCPVVRSRYRAADLCDGSGGPVGPPSRLEDARVLAVAGIARPRSFVSALSAQGARVVGTRFFADHHPFTGEEAKALVTEARRLEARIVTTEKDAARLALDPAEILVLRIESVLVEGEGDLDRLLEALRRAEGSETEARRDAADA
jgi:tetraacyldisaccharide 4'-kinase